MSENGLKTPVIPPANPKTLMIWAAGIFSLVALFLYVFQPILTPFAVSFAIAYALHPVVSFMETKGLRRTTATTLLVGLVIIFIVTVLLVTIPFLKDELLSLATKFPIYFDYLTTTLVPKAQKWVTIYPGILPDNVQHDLQTTITQNLSKMLSWVFQFIASFFSNALVIANLASLLLLSPLLIFYLLRDWPKILAFLESLVPPQMQYTTSNLGRNINGVMSGYFRGQASVCLIMALYYIIAFKIIGIHYGFTLGLLSGLLIFIPYVGFFISFTAALGVAIAQFSTLAEVLPVVLIYGVAQGVESFYLTPKLVWDRVGLHPVWVIFALFAGGYALGFLGVLISVPLAATLAVLLRFAMSKYHMLLAGTDFKA